MLQKYADIEILSWPYLCDGLTVGLTTGGRPKVFLKAINNSLRQRFTAAHELGHVLLPWHTELIECHSPDEETTDYIGGLREREASSFASHLLLPDRFLSPHCDNGVDMPALLDAVHTAEVSAAAGLIALTRSVPPGIALVLNETKPFYSHGTAYPRPTVFEEAGKPLLSKIAVEQGNVILRRQSVQWYKLEQFVKPRDVSDPRETTTLLRDAIAAITDDPIEQQHLVHVVNGVVGSALNSETARSTSVCALAAMRHRIRARPDLAALMKEPDFDLFLNRKASNFPGA
ncbi:hypothetical protein GCM10010123_18160 [Pilimelia anulata]|uniref:IrrE N-terminal-like domain-containing protein n=1 Tax=Pilimelia anulata TaxID=53371 RepID=A0A8J3B6P9_9ACTN|nr:ImmA/IrrE family metallo-endopeptidase [Pilimelia anulata]GGJ88955.1 hypothetical protein GCM10010123_18160 [Pilimelia anulata]